MVNRMYRIIKGPHLLQIQMTATLENVDKADIETRAFLKQLNKDRHVFRILLLMREALNNTIGPVTCNTPLTVNYHLKYKDGTLSMQVEDNGSGFDWHKEMEREKDSKACHGRGLFIMKKYSTRMQYNDKGNALTLDINLS